MVVGYLLIDMVYKELEKWQGTFSYVQELCKLC